VSHIFEAQRQNACEARGNAAQGEPGGHFDFSLSIAEEAAKRGRARPLRLRHAPEMKGQTNPIANCNWIAIRLSLDVKKCSFTS
jgi:hypothetical protein